MIFPAESALSRTDCSFEEQVRLGVQDLVRKSLFKNLVKNFWYFFNKWWNTEVAGRGVNIYQLNPNINHAYVEWSGKPYYIILQRASATAIPIYTFKYSKKQLDKRLSGHKKKARLNINALLRNNDQVKLHDHSSSLNNTVFN